MRHYYKIKDDGSKSGALPIKSDDSNAQYMADAQEANKQGYGIFWTVNSFKELRRKKELIKTLDYIFIDIDGRPTWEEVEKSLKRGLPPSMVIKTKNGFHIYWKFERPIKATPEAIAEYESILRYSLIPFYKADKNVSSVTTLLRVPGFYHQKDIADPFLIEKIIENKYTYTLSDFAYHYPRAETAKLLKEFKRKKKAGGAASFWEKVCELPCKESLERLSKHRSVRGDEFSFKNASTGLQIIVNGKVSANWIDEFDLIGSYQKGGPTIANWINWYWNDWFKVSQIIREVFPEIY